MWGKEVEKEKWRRRKKEKGKKRNLMEANEPATYAKGLETQRTALLTTCATQPAIVQNHENTCRSNQYSSSCARMRLGIGYSRAIAGNV